MWKGYLSLVLHAHLPYVRHPQDEHFLEEDWFYEAITETYMPLLQMMDRLAHDDVPYRLSLSLTPTLLSMFEDPLLKERYSRRLGQLLELAGKEVERTRWQPEFHQIAQHYQYTLQSIYTTYHDHYHQDLTAAFRRHQDRGNLEILGSAATHGFLPLMELNPEAVWSQIAMGVQTYQRALGSTPKGFWLPECAYQPGHDQLLADAGIKYFFTDSHGVLFASPRPKYGYYAPIYCPSGVAAFGRDIESSKQVWSATEGYPGDYEYRDFYRDIGYDLEYEYIKPYIHPSGLRKMTGLKYYKVTGRTHDKSPYNPHAAREKAALHAGNFVFNREKQVEYLYGLMDRKPIIISPYDAELFGHWWYEGIWFLECFIRKVAYDQNTFSLISPGDYLSIYPRNQVSTPSMSTWGYKGYNEVWLEGSNDWVYRHLHEAAQEMIHLAKARPQAHGIEERALNQASRELLFAQASDWAFIMKTGTMVQYAVRRTHDHLTRFLRLADEIKRGAIDEGHLAWLESEDNLFPDMDYRFYLGPERYPLPSEIALAR